MFENNIVKTNMLSKYVKNNKKKIPTQLKNVVVRYRYLFLSAYARYKRAK